MPKILCKKHSKLEDLIFHVIKKKKKKKRKKKKKERKKEKGLADLNVQPYRTRCNNIPRRKTAMSILYVVEIDHVPVI